MTRRQSDAYTGSRRRPAVAAVAALAVAGALAPAPMGTGLVARAARPVEGQAGVSAAAAGSGRFASAARISGAGQSFGNLNNPQGVATDGRSNLYIADTGNNQVVEAKTLGGAPAGSGGVISLATNLVSPVAVAVDRKGNVYIVDSINSGAIIKNDVLEVPVGGGSPPAGGCPQGGGQPPAGFGCPIVLPATGLRGPRGVAVDSQGNVYIADTGNNQVVELPRLRNGGFGSQITIGTGLSGPKGVAVGSLDDAYIADTGNNRVVKVSAGGGQQSIVASGLNAPQGVLANGADLFGATDDVYIADTGSNSLLVSTNGEAPTPLTLGGQALNAPIGLALDGAGGLYVASSGDNQVVDVKLPGSGQLASAGGGARGGQTPLAATPTAAPGAAAITATATPAAFGGPAIDADNFIQADAVHDQIGPGETQALSVVTAPGSLVRAAIITAAGYPQTAVLYLADGRGHFQGHPVKGKGVALATRPPGRRIAYLYRFMVRPYQKRGCALLTFTIPTHAALGAATMPVAVQRPYGRVLHLGGQLGAHFTVAVDPHDAPGSLHPTSPTQLAVIARKACLGQI